MDEIRLELTLKERKSKLEEKTFYHGTVTVTKKKAGIPRPYHESYLEFSITNKEDVTEIVDNMLEFVREYKYETAI